LFTIIGCVFFMGGQWCCTGICSLTLVFSTPLHFDLMPSLAGVQLGTTSTVVMFLTIIDLYDFPGPGHHGDLGLLSEFLPHAFVGTLLIALVCLVMWYAMLMPKFSTLMRRQMDLAEARPTSPPTTLSR
jgi:hypothetical protein